ncbi:MAG: carbohydrate kinase family protein [Thermoprotei archaeon]|nr:MAG: carbohydrate kinase family protein [Thermoprotei archaeon]
MALVFDVVTVGHVLADIRFMVDEFIGPDEEGVILEQSRGVGGSAANVAIGVRRLGLSSAIIAKVGFDSFGRIAVDELMKEGVDISGLKVSFSSTGFTIVIIDNKGQICLYGYKGASEELEPCDINVDIIEKTKYVHIASLRLDTSIEAARKAKEHGKMVSWDPGRVQSKAGLQKLKDLIKHVDIVLANEEEARNITSESDYKKAAEVIGELGPRLVVVKRGARGAYVLSEKECLEVPPLKPPKIVDTTGAGDAFAAGLLVGLARGYELSKALTYASATAALKIAKLGSHETPTHDEVIKFIWG